MSCDECRQLSSHVFRSPDDLIDALRVAAEEVDRGVLCRVGDELAAGSAERQALESALASGALPATVRYRFRCELCGDRFTLTADPSCGEGGWTREGEQEAH